MAGETVVTLVGNLVDDPELRFTPSGAAVANFRIASTPRTYDRQTGEWKDGESLFLSCSVWRQAAENVAESLQRGMRVIVQGRLKSRSYDDREGNKRTVFEIDVDEVGPSLRSATAKVTRAMRSGPGGEGGGGGFGGGGGGTRVPATAAARCRSAERPLGNPAGTSRWRPARPAERPWASQGGGSMEEPRSDPVRVVTR
jgi:single-strand DNA-binding protein